MPKGNPNPSPSTRIGAKNGPKPGKTSDQVAIDRSNADAAMRIRQRLLSATEARLVELSSEEVMALIEPAMLKLLTDSETRGLGAPVQRIGGEDGGAIVFKTIYETKP